MAPYAWSKRQRNVHEPLENIADQINPLQIAKDMFISHNLHVQFSSWVNDFEANSTDTNFPWELWNQRGVALARLLKEEVKEKFAIEYHVPLEDPHFTSLEVINEHIIPIR